MLRGHSETPRPRWADDPVGSRREAVGSPLAASQPAQPPASANGRPPRPPPRPSEGCVLSAFLGIRGRPRRRTTARRLAAPLGCPHASSALVPSPWRCPPSRLAICVASEGARAQATLKRGEGRGGRPRDRARHAAAERWSHSTVVATPAGPTLTPRSVKAAWVEAGERATEACKEVRGASKWERCAAAARQS